jgi:hypothetical protein
MAGRPKKEKTSVIYARIPIRLAKQIRADAERARRELSGQIRLIIENYYGEA